MLDLWDYVGLWHSGITSGCSEEYSLFLMTGDFSERGIIRGLGYDSDGWFKFNGAKTEKNISFTSVGPKGKRYNLGENQDGYFRGEWMEDKNSGLFTLIPESDIYRIKNPLARIHLVRDFNLLERKSRE